MRTSEEQDLINFATLWDEAIVSNDTDKISGFMSDDWVIVGSDGLKTKSTFLNLITLGTVTHNRMDSDELNIKIYGNTGIIVSRGTSAGTYNGHTFSLYEWSTSIFLKNEGQWLCILTMLTPANNP